MPENSNTGNAEVPPGNDSGPNRSDLRRASAVAYVRGRFFPPPPEVYADWLMELAERAESGAPADQEVEVPAYILESSHAPRNASYREDGTAHIQLGQILADLRQGHLLEED